MAFCMKCGSPVSEGDPLCPKCGAEIGMAAPPPVGVSRAGSTGLPENVAGLLCYLLGWLTGLIFLLIDRRPFVRFHAAQSVVVFGALTIIRIILGLALLGGGAIGFSIWGVLSTCVWLIGLALWIALMVMAYQGRTFEVPIAAPIAKNIAERVRV